MKKNEGFVRRLAQACGTSEPAKVQRLLNIPYQSAKNYLEGRIPHPDVLISISEKTLCSIDWLLTGRGKKIIANDVEQDTLVLTGQAEASVRRICLEVINEYRGENNPQPRTVVLHSGDLFTEKVIKEVETLTEKQA